MDDAERTIPELATRLGVDPNRIKAWIRRQNWRRASQEVSLQNLGQEQVAEIVTYFSTRVARNTSSQRQTPELEGPLPGLTVGELLETYNDVLLELRARRLVRTNNAPIGDIAEYCAALVYGGTLAPNSEKSHDLIAADGRKVQVKARVVRSTTSPSAVFSSIRSFDFDVCIFLLIDNDAGRVIEAREWTVSEVREQGRHRQHTNGTVIRIAQVRSSAVGLNKGVEFNAAWLRLLTQR